MNISSFLAHLLFFFPIKLIISNMPRQPRDHNYQKKNRFIKIPRNKFSITLNDVTKNYQSVTQKTRLIKNAFEMKCTTLFYIKRECDCVSNLNVLKNSPPHKKRNNEFHLRLVWVKIMCKVRVIFIERIKNTSYK
jgi:hypothetical protein